MNTKAPQPENIKERRMTHWWFDVLAVNVTSGGLKVTWHRLESHLA